MSSDQQLLEALESRVERRNERREFFKSALSAAAVTAAGAAVFMPTAASAQAVTDPDILNFALNLEYLEANFYSYAVFGTPIDASIATGTGTNGYAASATSSAGARAVAFTDPVVAQYAKEIAQDEIAHVKFLRTALGAAAVAQPQIDVGTAPTGAFSNAARAAGLITGATSSFDPYLNDNNFLLGAFIFEDVGVTAYKGASPLIANVTYLDAAAGILAAEAYHASIVRTVLYSKGIATPSLKLIEATEAISGARDSLDGATDDDQGVAPLTTGVGVTSNIAPADNNGIAFSRTTGQVLNIVYLDKTANTKGGFFPAGVNGTINKSAASG